MVELQLGTRLSALRLHKHIQAGTVLVVQKAEVDVLNVWYVQLAWTDSTTRRRMRVNLGRADLDDFEVVARNQKPIPPYQLRLDFRRSDICVDGD